MRYLLNLKKHIKIDILLFKTNNKILYTRRRHTRSNKGTICNLNTFFNCYYNHILLIITINFYHYIFEPDDNDCGFFIVLDSEHGVLSNTLFDNYESIHYENINTDSCELFNEIQQKIEYITTQIYMSVFIIYSYFNSSSVIVSNIP